MLKRLFGARSYANYPQASLPGYVVAAALVVAAFAAYLIGGADSETELRLTVLAAAGAALVIVAAHRLHATLGRWTALLVLPAYIFWLAGLWRQPDLLFLLLVPVVFAGLLLNLPAVGLAAVGLALLVPGLGALPPDRLGIFQAVLWLTAAAAGASIFLVERLLAQASQDYDRLQTALDDTRAHQFKLAQALEDLAFANRQLALLYDKNISLRKIAEEATEAKSIYIARVSHEIRTPLNMVLGITESIIEEEEAYGDEIPSDLLDDIRIIRRNSEHLLSLVNDVLDLTRAESSQLILKKDWVDIGAEIDTSIEIVQPLARKKRLAMKVAVQPGLPPMFCDRTRIRQVILNLLSNAVRYTEQGSVSVSAAADEHWLTVEVRDTGPGIEGDDVERVFEPFYRGSSSTTQETLGTGLGLSVCRQLVELHGGSVWVESRPGEGSCFAFRLPLLSAGKAGDGMPAPASRSPARFVGEQWMWMEPRRGRQFNFQQPQKKRVLVLDSEDSLWTRLDLENDTAEFERAENLEALAEATRGAPAHLVLVNAPDLPALQREMSRATICVPDTPILGCAFASPRQKLQAAGAVDYLQKPFSLGGLRQAVESAAPGALRILVVDDNVEVQRLVARALTVTDDGLEFVLASSGQEALALAASRRPDLVLLDLALPDINGWQVLAAMQADAILRSIPVIILSAHDLSDSPVRSPEAVLTRAEGISIDEFVRHAMESLNS